MLSGHAALTIGATLLAGLTMLRASLWTKAMTWRTQPRCPSCGRHLHGRHCRCTEL